MHADPVATSDERGHHERTSAAPPSREHHPLTESTKLFIDAAPAVITTAICRLDLAAPVVRALTALDLAGRFALLPARIGGNHAGDPAPFGMIWRTDAQETAERIRLAEFESFASPGYIKVRWTFEGVASDAGGTALHRHALRGHRRQGGRPPARRLERGRAAVARPQGACRPRRQDLAEELAGE